MRLAIPRLATTSNLVMGPGIPSVDFPVMSTSATPPSFSSVSSVPPEPATNCDKTINLLKTVS